MANVSRKAIAAALLQLIAQKSGTPFAQAGHRLTKPEQAANPNEPGLFLIKAYEKISNDGEGMPAMRTLYFTAAIFTDVSGQPNVAPADVIDDLLDYVTVQLASNATTGNPLNGQRQTLGGALGVYDCVVDGEIRIAAGDLVNKGQTLVPIKVTLGQYP